MAHYAKLNFDNIVEQVIVIDNDQELVNGIEDEEAGISFCAMLTGHSNWKKTSYNGRIRKQYAGIGFTYDPIKDVFISPQPFPSWFCDENFDWQPPTPMPQDENTYYWDENTVSWKPSPPSESFSDNSA